MTERLEQRYCIQFCQNLNNSQVETIQKIQMAFNDYAMGVTHIKEWYNWFKNDHSSVDSKPCSDHPSTSQNDQVIAKVNTVLMRHCRVTIQEIVENVDISTFSAHSILTDDLTITMLQHTI